MPYARVACIVALAGLGAVAAAVAGPAEPDPPSHSSSASAPDLHGSRLLTPATPGPTPSLPAFDVRAENAKDGGSRGQWRISRARGSASGLAVDMLTPSVEPGQQVRLQISRTAGVANPAPVTVRTLRIGWYGGTGSRQLQVGDHTPQPDGALRIDTAGWPPGSYLLRVSQGDATRFAPVIVRSTEARGRVLLLSSPETWAAESSAGAIDTGPNAGAGGYLTGEAGLVQQAERDLGNLAYATDADVGADPGLLAGASAIVAGNSRSWTPELRQAVRAAAARGTNVAFFGAGTGRDTVEGSGEVTTPASAIAGLSRQRPACTDVAGALPWTVTDAAWWGYRGTGAYPGLLVPGLVRGLVDGVSSSSGATPTVVGQTYLTCEGVRARQAGTYRVLPSGAAVFATGTSGWTCTLDRTCAASPQVRAFTVRVTRNVLRGIARARAGARHS